MTLILHVLANENNILYIMTCEATVPKLNGIKLDNRHYFLRDGVN